MAFEHNSQRHSSLGLVVSSSPAQFCSQRTVLLPTCVSRALLRPSFSLRDRDAVAQWPTRTKAPRSGQLDRKARSYDGIAPLPRDANEPNRSGQLDHASPVMPWTASRCAHSIDYAMAPLGVGRVAYCRRLVRLRRATLRSAPRWPTTPNQIPGPALPDMQLPTARDAPGACSAPGGRSSTPSAERSHFRFRLRRNYDHHQRVEASTSSPPRPRDAWTWAAPPPSNRTSPSVTVLRRRHQVRDRRR